MNETTHSNLDFSLTHGGPLFALLQSTRLAARTRFEALRSGLLLAAAAWGPMMLFALPFWIQSKAVDPLMRDPAVHARLLIAIPLLFLAEATLEERSAASFRHVVEGYAHRQAAAESIARSAERMRDSKLAEAVMFVVAVGFGQLALWGSSRGSGALHGVEIGSSLSASFTWYALVALPVFQFLLFRSLYRWAIWSRMLVSLSRLELDLVPIHPDLAGGLGLIGEPVEAFAFIVLASSAVVAATWGYRVIVFSMDLKAFTSPFILLVTIVMLLAFGPLLCFTARLWSARLHALRQYSELARRYTTRFHRTWVVNPDDSVLLGKGSDHIAGLADLGTSYERIGHMRIVPVEPRLAIIVLAATVGPMLPIFALVKPLPELFTMLGRALFGGLSH